MKNSSKEPPYLPGLVALYDALNDDDGEIRDLAANAASYILGQQLAPLEAATRLLHWLGQTFGHHEGFRNLAACRIVGHSSAARMATPVLPIWEPAESQLATAMKFDESLFVIEEQNLFVEEAREAERWTGIFASLPRPDPDPTLDLLETWTMAGLQSIGRITEVEGDKALGWTSRPEVYAIITRIVSSSRLLLGLGRCQGARPLLERMRHF
jgi:hypothetical protein